MLVEHAQRRFDEGQLWPTLVTNPALHQEQATSGRTRLRWRSSNSRFGVKTWQVFTIFVTWGSICHSSPVLNNKFRAKTCQVWSYRELLPPNEKARVLYHYNSFIHSDKQKSPCQDSGGLVVLSPIRWSALALATGCRSEYNTSGE